MKKKSVRNVDILGDLESAHFEMLAEITSLARRLALLARASQTIALGLAEARGRESSARLCTILRMEAAARLKKPGKDVSLPGRRARKG
jgi:hypothetical protein